MREKQLYETKLKDLLAAWAAEIESLQARAESARPSMRDAARDKITELRARRELVHQKTEALKASQADSWKDSKSDAAAAADAFTQALRSVRDRL